MPAESARVIPAVAPFRSRVQAVPSVIRGPAWRRFGVVQGHHMETTLGYRNPTEIRGYGSRTCARTRSQTPGWWLVFLYRDHALEGAPTGLITLFDAPTMSYRPALQHPRSGIR
jgi:hypothetical protein